MGEFDELQSEFPENSYRAPSLVRSTRRIMRLLTCPRCGDEFHTTHFRKRFCSQRCREAAYEAERRLKRMLGI